MTLPLLLALTSAHAAGLRADVLPAGPGLPAERATLALPVGPELGPPQVLSAGGGTTVRFEQTLNGVPVLGATVAARVRPDGRVSALRDGRVQGLSVDVVPTLGLDAALAAADISADRVSRSRLAVLPFGQGLLVWELLVSGAGGPEWQVLDAHTGALVQRRSALMEALGRVYAENPERTPRTVDVELADLDEGDRLTGWEGNLRVVRYQSGDISNNPTVVQEVVPNSGADFLYDPPSDPLDDTDAFAEVNAYHHITRARHFYQGVTGLDMSASSWALTVVANGMSGGSPLDNAFFNPAGLTGPLGAPNAIIIGQGSQFDFAVDADVFVHEFGHYVSTNAIGYNQGQFGQTPLGLSPWTGSVDEGIADYFACSMFDDPELGEATLASLGASRDLSDDSGRCPEDIFGEVHMDGELVGHAAWLLREAYGAEAADAVVWGAMSLLDGNSDLGTFGDAMRQVAQELVDDGVIGSIEPAEQALAATGLDDCAAVQDISDGPLTLTLWGFDLLAGGFGLTCEQASIYAELIDLQSFFHVAMPTSEDALGVRFDVALDPTTSGALSWRIALREGEPVGFAPGPLIPTVSEFDLESEVFTTETGSVTIEGDAFTPGSTWYAVLLSDSCPTSMATISAEELLPEPVDTAPDSEPGDDKDPVEPGCGGCDAGATGGGWLGLLALGALLRRRSRGAVARA